MSSFFIFLMAYKPSVPTHQGTRAPLLKGEGIMYYQYRVTIVVDDLGMCEFYLHWAEEFAALARKRGQHPLLNRDVQFNITWAMRYLDDAIDGSIYLGMADHEAFMELYNELWDRRKAIEK